MNERDSLHPLGTWPQTRWLAGKDRVDMAAAGPPPRPADARHDAAARDARSRADRAHDHRHAERLLRRAAAGSITSASTTRPTGRRSRRCSACCRACAGAACRWCGSTGATGPTWPTCRPTSIHLYKPHGHGHRPRRPAAGHWRARAARRTAGRPRWSTSWSIAPERHPRRQVPHQRLLGHAARQHPAQPRHLARCCSPASTPTSACCARCRTRTSSATAACCSRTAARPPRPRSAPRRRCSTSRSASASSPIRTRCSAGWRRADFLLLSIG